MKSKFLIFKFDIDGAKYKTTSFERMKINGNSVPDNYWQRADYGSKVTDAMLAYMHSMSISMQLQKSIIRNERLCLQNLLTRDFEYFLKALKNQGEGYKEHAKTLLNNLFSYGVFSGIPDLIKQYYFDIYNKPDNAIKCDLDFYDLYLNAGDKVLFNQHNVVLAMEYYRLASWQWTNDVSISESVDENYKFKRYWSQQLVFIEGLRTGLLDKEDSEEFVLRYKELSGLLNTFFEIKRVVLIPRTKVDYNCVTRLTDRFFEEYECLWIHSANHRNDALPRFAKIMVHSVIDEALLYCLCSMRRLSDRAKSSLKTGVFKLLMYYSKENLKPLQGYLEENIQYKDVINNIIHGALVIYFCNEIRRNLRYKQNTTVAYYTTLDNMLYMTPAKCNVPEEFGCWSLMNISYMNDPNEGKLLLDCLREGNEEKYQFSKRKGIAVPYSFFKCFTTLVDYLPMWQMYADNAEGVCLVLKTSDIINAIGSSKLYRVCYLSKDNNGKYTANERFIDNYLNELRKLAEYFVSEYDLKYLRELLGDVSYLFKDSCYAYEQEVRIIRSYDGASKDFRHTNIQDAAAKLFVKLEHVLPIVEVIVGPKFKNMGDRIPYLQEQLTIMCQSSGIKIPEITVSSIDYR